MAENITQAGETAEEMERMMGEISVLLGQVEGFLNHLVAKANLEEVAPPHGTESTLVQVESVKESIGALGAEITSLVEHLVDMRA